MGNHLKSLFCDHDYRFVRNIYGDDINRHCGNRSVWECSKCGKLKWSKHLHHDAEAMSPAAEKIFDGMMDEIMSGRPRRGGNPYADYFSSVKPPDDEAKYKQSLAGRMRVDGYESEIFNLKQENKRLIESNDKLYNIIEDLLFSYEMADIEGISPSVAEGFRKRREEAMEAVERQ